MTITISVLTESPTRFCVIVRSRQ